MTAIQDAVELAQSIRRRRARADHELGKFLPRQLEVCRRRAESARLRSQQSAIDSMVQYHGFVAYFAKNGTIGQEPSIASGREAPPPARVAHRDERRA